MIVNDNGREYDVDKLDNYSSMTQSIINRLIYARYVGIRNVLSNSSCNKLKGSRIKEMINDPNSMNKIKNIFDYSDKEIIFYVDYAIKNFPMVK